MKRILTSVAVVMSLYSGAFVAEARADEQPCSNATLQGSYGFHEQGTIFAQGLQGGVGVVIFDGNGNLVTTGTFVNQTTGVLPLSSSSTYAVNADCTGSIVADTGAIWDLVIVDNGNECYLEPTGGDRVVIWVLKRQSPVHQDESLRGADPARP